MNVAVHETGRDEAATEVDHISVGELVAADIIAAQPGDDAAADGHRGGFGVGRAVHSPVYQQRCGDL